MCSQGSSDLPSGLRDWLYAFGFEKQNLSDAEVENEFQRLTPPEMRDIWRHVMIHVVPVQRKRYVEKVLLLHELKKQQPKKGNSRPLPKNLRSVAELETYRSYEKTLLQLSNQELLIRDKCTRIEELKQNYRELNEERGCLVQNKETQNHVLTLLRQKRNRYEKLNEELINIRECLNYVGSHLWNSNTTELLQPTEAQMKHLIEKVHEFGIRRHTLNETELISEQQKLQESIIASTINIVPSALQKNVIKLLENTLLKLADIVEEKGQETNNYGDFEWDLSELKKQCVHKYLDNQDYRMRVKAQEEKVQEAFSKLILHFEKSCKDEDEKTTMRNWLDMEHLKCRMTSRFKFLSKMKDIATNQMSILSETVFKNDSERKIFLKRILEIRDQLNILEKEINSNMCYLSDKSINLFVNYQQMCRKKIENFVRVEEPTNSKEICMELPDFLQTEIELLRNLDRFSTNCSNSKTTENEIPNTNVVEYTRRANFLLYLESAYNSLFRRFGDVNYSNAVLGDRVLKVKSSEDEFRLFLKNLLEEAKDNLQSIEKETNTCAKNMKLWTDFSVDDLIPEHMVVEKYTFSQWKEKYRSYLRNFAK